MEIEGGFRQRGSGALIFPPSATDVKSTQMLISLREKLEEADRLTTELTEQIETFKEMQERMGKDS